MSRERLLDDLEAYYDAAPRLAARAEELGPFTLFVSERAPWPYYARPRDGLRIGPRDVERVRERQRALGVPEAFEWIGERHPDLRALLEAEGFGVLPAPLMVLDPDATPSPVAAGVRLLVPDDPLLGQARAVAEIGFSAPGTACGPAGAPERDAVAAGFDDAALRATAERLERRVAVTAVAERDGGPVAVGTHQPVGDATEIVGVATLPSHRRQGLAASVTAALVTDALAHGARLVLLSAGSDEIARVYASQGFRRVATHCMADPASESNDG